MRSASSSSAGTDAGSVLLSSASSSSSTRSPSILVPSASFGLGGNCCESLPETVDVVIIGAGPTGLTMACELARRNVNFVILDVNAGSVAHSRALMLHSRTLEICADLGLIESCIGNGHIIRGTNLYTNGKMTMDLKMTSLQTQYPFILALEQKQTEKILIDRLSTLGHDIYRPAAVLKIEIPDTNEVWRLTDPLGPLCGSMFAAAQFSLAQPFAAASGSSSSGVGTPSAGLVSSVSAPLSSYASSALLEVSHGDPLAGDRLAVPMCVVHVKPLDIYSGGSSGGFFPTKQVRCKYIVGCDGVNSVVRKALSIGFVSLTDRVEYLVADITVRWGFPLASDRMHLVQSGSGGVLIALPLSENRWRVMCMRKSSAGGGEGGVGSDAAAAGVVDVQSENFQRLEQPDLSELQQILEAYVPATSLEALDWVSAYSTKSFVCQSFRRSSALLCGDAAHSHSPIFCQGINAGIQDAYNLGWKLAAVVRGANPDILNSYDVERREVANVMVQQSLTVFEKFLKPGLMFRIAASIFGSLLSSIETLFPSYAKALSQIDLSYPPSNIISKNNVASGCIEPGARLPTAPIISVPLDTFEEYKNGSDTPKPLANLTRGGAHSLLLFLHVLPMGTKAKTVLGCERQEDAIRWSGQCLERLARLSRLLTETFKGRNSEVCSGGLRTVWVLCGLVDFRNAKTNIGLKQVRELVPQRLLLFFARSGRGEQKPSVVVDHEGLVHSGIGLKLADPDGAEGEEKSGAFILVRPDGHISCNGYAGDSSALGFAFDYVLTWLSDS